MNAKVLLGNSLVLLLLLSSCQLLKDMEDPMVPDDVEDSGQLPSLICATATYMESMPKFPGGQEQMWQFLADNLEWPAEFGDVCVIGKVVARVTVEKNGEISSVQIAKSLTPCLDVETIRVIKKMPKWIPGTVDGEPARCEFLLPIKWTIG